MEVVGSVATVIALGQAARAIIQTIVRLRMSYPQRCSRLLKLARELDRVLQSAGRVSEPTAELVASSLKDVQSTLDSLAEPGIRRTASRIIGGCFGGHGDEAKLIGAEEKLRILAVQVVVQANFLQLRKKIPQIFNDRMELPLSPVGLDRAKPILDFLEASKAEEFRVVGIHGLPGVGKSTLLKYIWNEVSSKSPFLVRAHVQIGHDVPPEKLCQLQTSILDQLGGGRIEFTSCDGGKEKLYENFDKLRGNKQPVFLAIDNVFDVEHMIQLLPSRLSKDLLPASSCIVVTCRDYAVIRALLNTCCLNERNLSQVFCHTPTCLDIDESKAVFAACGDLSPLGDAELLDTLVPLCKGLPLALSVLGRTFAGEARRERKEWESIAEQMQVLDEEDSETSPVIKSLKISYDLLSDSRKAAFLDVVNIFYGWPWDRVERILGAKVMKDLKDSSLISAADHWFRCNQSALRLGYANQESCTWFEPVVTMHDLILKFGEHLPCKITVTRQTFTGFQPLDSLLQDLEAHKLRSLVLLTFDQLQGLDRFLERTANLQTLLVNFSTEGRLHLQSEISIGVMNHSISMQSRSLQSLRFLSLTSWKFSRLPMETKLSQLREICLYGCNNVIQLPETPLCQLEWLGIHKCANFQGFSRDCVQNWQKLQHLEVRECNNVTTIPIELGYLKNLTSLVFLNLRSLTTFPNLFCPCLRKLQLTGLPITNLHLETPSLECLDVCCDSTLRGLPEVIRNALALQKLRLSNCDNLKELPDEVEHWTSLIILDVKECKNLKQLPRAIGNASSLKVLGLGNCDSLEELPDEVGQLTALTELDVSGCKNLNQLPRAIGNASSLQVLCLGNCDSLEELPDEVGQLTSLVILDVKQCKNLKQLPRAIGNASSLDGLCLSNCDSLVELPDEVGQLTSLTELDVSGCKKLKQLPRAIGNASSLEVLGLANCDSLEELPDEVGQLTSLRELDVSGCMNLKQLPRAIGNASCLECLRLRNCDSMEELPDEVGQLTSLRELDVSGCKNLKQLPQAIGNASSLECLRLSNCDSLAGLPDEVGQLTSLTELDVSGCKNLKQLPRAIGNASSLEELCLGNCGSLEELPDEVGQLTSLRELNVSGCMNLKQLPRAIGKASSLKVLWLGNCDSVEELPDEVGHLTSLRELDVSGCKNLKQLPRAIGNASSLECLRLSNCDSMEELPDEVGQLTSLRELDVSGCENLKQLPQAIGNASSLLVLGLGNCNSLEKLPDEVGQLIALTELDVSGCKNLNQLPRAIGNVSSLEVLYLGNCDSLEELPDEVGQLTSLVILDVKECKKLRKLPRAIGNASSLDVLCLGNCDSLEELPDEVGQLTSLTKLDVSGCKNLKQLPRAIGNASSLEELCLGNCGSLEELPDEVGQLTSLTELDVSGCKNLKQLPQAIGNASSLEVLCLGNCDSLEELPDEMGQLTLLRELNVSGCINLKQLPRAIGNASSLECLRLSNCDSLKELPDEVGLLTSLIELDVSGCMNLKQLPRAIGNASSLKWLRLSNL